MGIVLIAILMSCVMTQAKNTYHTLQSKSNNSKHKAKMPGKPQKKKPIFEGFDFEDITVNKDNINEDNKQTVITEFFEKYPIQFGMPYENQEELSLDSAYRIVPSWLEVGLLLLHFSIGLLHNGIMLRRNFLMHGSIALIHIICIHIMAHVNKIRYTFTPVKNKDKITLNVKYTRTRNWVYIINVLVLAADTYLFLTNKW